MISCTKMVVKCICSDGVVRTVNWLFRFFFKNFITDLTFILLICQSYHDLESRCSLETSVGLQCFFWERTHTKYGVKTWSWINMKTSSQWWDMVEGASCLGAHFLPLDVDSLPSSSVNSLNIVYILSLHFYSLCLLFKSFLLHNLYIVFLIL